MRNDNACVTPMAARAFLRREAETRPTASRAADILTISDNPFLVPYLSGLFQRSGWTVDGAGTRQAGIAYLHTRRAAVAVCDETLPDGSWRDVASTLPLLPDAPTLVVIGDDPSLLDEVAALGGFDVLARPIREADVVWTIASAWHAWRKRFDENAKGVIRCSDA